MHFLCEFHPRGKKEIVQPGVVDKGGIRALGTQCYQFNSWGEEKDRGGGGGKGRINVGGRRELEKMCAQEWKRK